MGATLIAMRRCRVRGQPTFAKDGYTVSGTFDDMYGGINFERQEAADAIWYFLFAPWF
jgi:hypothetical protein